MTIREVLEHPEKFSFDVDRLGECTIDSPIEGGRFAEDGERTLVVHDEAVVVEAIRAGRRLPSFEKAGPRRRIFFDPAWCRAAVVTCGGLCPGLNDVIKGVVQTLWFDYGVRHIFGIRYGLEGLIPSYRHEPMILTPEVVDEIDTIGGTILGSSRGGQPTDQIVRRLADMNINLLFCIGGDGTLRAARDIAEEVKRRKLSIAVVGVPKTIDNDLAFVGRSFGFETAVYATTDVITCAHMEAKGAWHGVGLVKLQGRDSGFIAAYASVANSCVNLCLVPEEPFTLEGEHGVLTALDRRFGLGKSHAVIVVAEGAGQDLMAGEERRDASGNILKKDIGTFLKSAIEEHFRKKGEPVSVKYFDPSYSIRSVAAHGADAIHCLMLAKGAVHAAMAGRTNCVVGKCADVYMHVPIALATIERQKIDPDGTLWQAVRAVTRQDGYLGYKPLVKG